MALGQVITTLVEGKLSQAQIAQGSPALSLHSLTLFAAPEAPITFRLPMVSTGGIKNLKTSARYKLKFGVNSCVCQRKWGERAYSWIRLLKPVH